MNYAPFEWHRVASTRRKKAVPLPPSPHPIKVHANHVYIYIYTCTHIHIAHPPHVMNIFTLIAGLGIFHLPPCRPIHRERMLYLYRRDVSDLSRVRSIHSFRREDDPIEGTGLIIPPTETEGRIVAASFAIFYSFVFRGRRYISDDIFQI